MLRLLIVDDEANIVRAFTRAFKYDFEVITAFTLDEAKAKISGADLLLSDFNIGHETPESIVGVIPTVVMTGRPEQAKKALPEGTVILTKPAGNDEIRAALLGLVAKVA